MVIILILSVIRFRFRNFYIYNHNHTDLGKKKFSLKCGEETNSLFSDFSFLTRSSCCCGRFSLKLILSGILSHSRTIYRPFWRPLSPLGISRNLLPSSLAGFVGVNFMIRTRIGDDRAAMLFSDTAANRTVSSRS